MTHLSPFTDCFTPCPYDSCVSDCDRLTLIVFTCPSLIFFAFSMQDCLPDYPCTDLSASKDHSIYKVFDHPSHAFGSYFPCSHPAATLHGCQWLSGPRSESLQLESIYFAKYLNICLWSYNTRFI